MSAATTNGIDARENSIVYASGANIASCGDVAVKASSGARVIADGATCTGAAGTNAIVAQNSSFVSIISGTAGSTGTTFLVNNGGTIVSNGTTGTKSQLVSNATTDGIIYSSSDTGSTLTLSSGVVTATASFHLIDTEGGAATDDLDTINGGQTGDTITFRPVSNIRDVTFKNGTGNMILSAGDVILPTNANTISLIKSGSSWYQI